MIFTPSAAPALSSRLLWLVFTSALVIRFAYVLGFYLGIGPDALTANDSIVYASSASQILDQGLGAWQVDLMPLYPLFLAAHYAIQGSTDPLFPVLTQCALDACTAVMAGLIAGRLDRNLALPAGLFAALCPTLIITAGIIYTDSLFLFFATAALLAAQRWLQRPGWACAILLGTTLGLALFTRVMIAPWAAGLLAALPLGALLLRRFNWRAPLQMGLVAFLCAGLQSPVLVRNAIEFDSFGLTAQGGSHALYWIVPLVREAVDGTSQEAGADDLRQRFNATDAATETNPFRRSNAMSAYALDELGHLGLGAIAKGWTIGAAINLGAPATILSPPVADLPRTGFYDTPGVSKGEKMVNFLFANDNPGYAWILLISLAGLGLVRLVQLGGVLSLACRGREVRIALLLLLGWIAFILLINGPIASAKYRLPIEPAMGIFFAQGFRVFVERWRGRARPILRRHR